MKYFLLLLLSVVWGSASFAAGPLNRYSRGNGTASAVSSTAANNCQRPVNYRNKCDSSQGYSWSDAVCGCAKAGAAGASPTPEGQNPGTAEMTSSVEQAINQCKTDLGAAQSDCDEQQDAGVQSAQSTVSNFAVGMGSQMGVAGACSGLGKVIAGANGAVAAFAQMCSSSRTKCIASCNNAKTLIQSTSGISTFNYMDQVVGALNTCRNLDSQVARATQAIANTVGTVQGASSCAKDTSTDLFDYCQSNPTAIGCSTASTDCSNPTVAASNQICICKANPTAANCVGASLKADGSGNFDTSSLSAGNSAGSSGTLDSGSGLIGDADWQGDPNAKPNTARADDVGGSKGGRPLDEGGGGKGGGAGGGPGGAAAGTPVSVNAGFRGGGGGGGSWGNGGGGTWVTGDTAAQAAAKAANGPDLRQFLPGGKFDPKNRGLAGLSGPDGITGPHTDIWKKIQNRYQIEQPRLMP